MEDPQTNLHLCHTDETDAPIRQELLASLEQPVLIVSTTVGRGNVSVAETIQEAFPPDALVYHIPIEDVLPPAAVHEDLTRYRLISNRAPWLLRMIYTVPVFYYRKLWRERALASTDLNRLEETMKSLGIRTVIAVSHRPAFWVSLLKMRGRHEAALWGVLTEFGRSLGWRYICWDAMDGYFSPVDRHHLDYPFPPRLRFVKTGLPARRRFFDLACTRGDVDRVLFMAGYWGQMSFRRVVNVLSPLLRDLRTLRFDVVCGVNERLDYRLRTYFKNEPRVTVHGKKDSVEELLGGCASVITKPGFATIVETRAADRALFLLKGMPVAEDHNAAYAITHLGGRWFTVEDFELWYRGGRGLGGTLPWRAIPPLF